MEMCRNLFLTVLLFLPTFFAEAKEVVIIGTSTDFPGYELYVSDYGSAVAQSPRLIADATIGDDGRFSVSFDLNEPKRIRLELAAWSADIYVLPGESYEVVLQRPKEPLPRTFDGNPLEVVFIDLPDSDPNALMERFRRRYTSLFGRLELAMELSVHRGEAAVDSANAVAGDSLELIPSVAEAFRLFSEDVDGWRRSTRDTYTQDLLRSALGRVDLALGARRSYVDSVYGAKGLPNLNNPEAVQLFAEVHELVLADDPAAEERFFAALRTSDAELLLATLQKFRAFEDADRAWLYTLIRCRSLAANGGQLQSGILKLLDAQRSELRPELAELSAEIERSIVRGSTMAAPFFPDLTLIDQRGERINLSELEGKFVYLSVVAIGSASCEREMMVMEPLWEKFKRQVEFITVAMDADELNFKNYLAMHPTREWRIVNGGSNPELKYALRLRTIPSFYLVGPDGKLINNATRSPSEGIHDTFVRLLR